MFSKKQEATEATTPFFADLPSGSQYSMTFKGAFKDTATFINQHLQKYPTHKVVATTISPTLFNKEFPTQYGLLQSFELFRHSINNIEVITFDEFYERVKRIVLKTSISKSK